MLLAVVRLLAMDESDGQNAKSSDEPSRAGLSHMSNGVVRNIETGLNRYSTVLTQDHDFPGAQVRTLHS